MRLEGTLAAARPDSFLLHVRSGGSCRHLERTGPMTASLKDFPDYIKEGLAYHEAFRKMGFPPEEIFFGHTDGSDGQGIAIAIVLQAQGKRFTCTIHTGLQEPLKQVQDRWSAATAAWNVADDDELDAIWTKSEVCRRKVEFIAAMQARGFRLPLGAESYIPTSLKT